jgi:hypothetical protein
MEHGEMIANFNTGPAAGYLFIWLWIGACFIASAVLIILDELLRPRVVFGLGILENERRRREDAEEEIIQLESKVEAQEVHIEYLEGENETLRELARRRGFLRDEESEDHTETLRPRYTRDQWAEMLGGDEEEDNSIEL